MTRRGSSVVPAVIALAALGAAPAAARADVLSLRVEGHGGGAGGAGIGGAQRDEAFFNGARGPAYGFLVGIEALFVDVWVDHHQILAGDPLSTWTQFMAGFDLDHELRKPRPEGGGEGKQTGYFEVGVGLGFGVGTGQQVELPLNAAQVSDRAFLIEGKLGAGMTLGRGTIGLGVSLPVSVGYFFKSGFANDADNHYWGAQAALLVVVRGKIKLK